MAKAVATARFSLRTSSWTISELVRLLAAEGQPVVERAPVPQQRETDLELLYFIPIGKHPLIFFSFGRVILLYSI
jgi:hypothetical protein